MACAAASQTGAVLATVVFAAKQLVVANTFSVLSLCHDSQHEFQACTACPLYPSFFIVCTQHTFAQTGTLTGKVNDGNGAPLAGATVTIKNTQKMTNTNEQGIFAFADAPQNGRLVVSYVGFATQNFGYSNNQTGTITMHEAAAENSEVVVTGVFDKRTALQSSVAISTLKKETISKMTPDGATDLLSYTPGVYVNSAVGEINNTVFSRGVNANQFSVAGGNGYYYVSLMEDGLPVTNISSGDVGIQVVFTGLMLLISFGIRERRFSFHYRG